MSRRENAPTARELAKMLAVLVDINCASYPTTPQAVTLDIEYPSGEGRTRFS